MSFQQQLERMLPNLMPDQIQVSHHFGASDYLTGAVEISVNRASFTLNLLSPVSGNVTIKSIPGQSNLLQVQILDNSGFSHIFQLNEVQSWGQVSAGQSLGLLYPQNNSVQLQYRIEDSFGRILDPESWWNAGFDDFSQQATAASPVQHMLQNDVQDGVAQYSAGSHAFAQSVLNAAHKTGTVALAMPGPFAIDMDGDGLESSGHQLVMRDPGNVMPAPGQSKQATHWVSGDDALLALDRNGNGMIDNAGELFSLGDMPPGGPQYANLRALDTNQDNVINYADYDFHRLLVWRDANQDGVSQVQEINPASATGLYSLELGHNFPSEPTPNGYQVNYSGLAHTSSGPHRAGQLSANPNNLDGLLQNFYQQKSGPPMQPGEPIPPNFPQLQGSGWVPDLVTACKTVPNLSNNLTQFQGYLNPRPDNSQFSQLNMLLEHWAQAASHGSLQQQAQAAGISLDYQIELPFNESRDSFLQKLGLVERFSGILFSGQQGQASTELLSQAGAGSTHTVYFNLPAAQAIVQSWNALQQGVYTNLLLSSQPVKNLTAMLSDHLQTKPADFVQFENALLSNTPPWMVVEFINGYGPMNLQKLGWDAIGFLAEHSQQFGGYLQHLVEIDQFSIWRKNWPVQNGMQENLRPTIFMNGMSDPYLRGDNLYLGADQTDYLRGMDGDDLLYGGAGDDDLGSHFSSSGTNGNDWLNGGSGNDTLNGGNGNDTLQGGNGNDRLSDKGGSNLLSGGAGDDVLFSGADATLSGDKGNDRLELGDGSNTIRFAKGDGVDEIESFGEIKGKLNILQLGTGLNVSDLRVQAINTDLKLIFANGSDEIILRAALLNSPLRRPVDEVHFADGTKLDFAALMQRLSLGTEYADHLYGTAGDDILNGLGGDDTLEGGAGNDLLKGEDGADVLLGGEGDDTLWGRDGKDILVGEQGNDFFNGGSGNDELVDDSGYNTIAFAPGDGNDILRSSSNPQQVKFNTLQLDASIPASKLLPQRIGNDLLLKINGNVNDSLLVQNFFINNNPQDLQNPLQKISFADGSSWEVNAISDRALQGGGGNDNINGTLMGDKLQGFDGNDQINGLNGNDSLYGGIGNDSLDGGVGNDLLDGGAGLYNTYKFGKGDGQDTIASFYETSLTKNNVLQLKSGVVSGEVLLSRVGDSLQLRFANNSLDKITINGFFTFDNPYNMENPVQRIAFADGSTWNIDTIKLRALAGTNGNDTITGTSAADTINGGDGNDVLNGRAGNDFLSGGNGTDKLLGDYGDDRLEGGAGNDTLEGGFGNDNLLGGSGNNIYIFAPGFGQDKLLSAYDGNSTRVNQIQLQSGLGADKLVLTKQNSDLKIAVSGSTDSILVQNFYYQDNPNSNYNPLQQIKFADGSVWNLGDIISRVSPAAALSMQEPVSLVGQGAALELI